MKHGRVWLEGVQLGRVRKGDDGMGEGWKVRRKWWERGHVGRVGGMKGKEGKVCHGKGGLERKGCGCKSVGRFGYGWGYGWRIGVG